MKKSKQLTKVLVGTLIGMTVLLVRRDSRSAFLSTFHHTSKKAKQYVDKPSEMVHDLRLSYQSLSSYLNTVSNQVITNMSKLERMLDKLEDK